MLVRSPSALEARFLVAKSIGRSCRAKARLLEVKFQHLPLDRRGLATSTARSACKLDPERTGGVTYRAASAHHA